MTPGVVGVSASPRHAFPKMPRGAIRLLAGLGVDGDAQAGETVKHRSRVAVDPAQPNLRQVHLVASELLEELRAKGFRVEPGAIGENVLTRGLALIDLPAGARVHLGAEAAVEITGLRNPCRQLDGFQDGLMAAMLDRDAEGRLIRKAGVMGVVVKGGLVEPGDAIHIALPPLPHRRLERV